MLTRLFPMIRWPAPAVAGVLMSMQHIKRDCCQLSPTSATVGVDNRYFPVRGVPDILTCSYVSYEVQIFCISATACSLYGSNLTPHASLSPYPAPSPPNAPIPVRSLLLPPSYFPDETDSLKILTYFK